MFLKIDTNCLPPHPSASESVASVHRALHARVDLGELPFLRLHEDEGTIACVEEAAALAQSSFDDAVVLGIGGSSLGGRALVRALGGAGLRLHFSDNVDPERLHRLLADLDLSRTLFYVVSKSGSTLETIAQFRIVRERLIAYFGEEGYRERVVIATDPQQGFLRALVQREDLRAFELPPGVGGRFSGLTPAGLFPAALAGVDIRRVMKGMAWAVERVQSPNPAENQVLGLADRLVTLDQAGGRSVLATVPYSEALRPVGDWFAQLWAESLGKGGRGPTVVTATGSTAQHSQLQRWMDGQPTHVLVFIEVASVAHDLRVPSDDFAHDPDVGWMTGHTLSHILRVEREATEQALFEAGHPSMTWRLPSLCPESVGALLVCLEALTAYAGGLYGINPFDQPGVEQGKKNARRLLGG